MAEQVAMLAGLKQLPSLLLIIFCMAAFQQGGAAASYNLSAQAATLLQFKKGLVGDDGVLSNWNSANLASVCSWEGVLCRNSSTIVGLDFAYFNLNGTLTPPLCELPSLTHLYLRYNSFNQSFPYFLLESCPLLKVLDLSLNFFYGPLPSNISKLSQLQYFSLEGNNFEGPVPADFGNLPHLTLLRLRGNSLSGTIPRQLGNLSSLQILDLASCGFDAGGIPSQLGNLVSLKRLELPNCNLVGSIPTSLANLAHLSSLNLPTNSLSGSIPPSFTNLTNLSYIYLSENLLSGSIPPFSNLSYLIVIDLSNNSLSGSLPESFAHLSSSLSFLNLYNNQLNGTLPDGLATLANLSTVALYQNNFSGNLSSQWGLHSSLSYFDISDNSFTGSIPPRLCYGNTIIYISVENNRLTGEIPTTYASCQSVIRFVVDGNKLSGSVPSGLWTLPSLQVLMLQNNDFSGNINLPKSSSNCSLQVLNIDSNQFEGPIPTQISQFWPNLTKLSASQNKLSGSLPSQIGLLTNLETLTLSSNSISGEIPASIGNCSRLNSLYLSQNQLSGPIPSQLSLISDLSYLDLSINHLNGSIPNAFAKSTYLLFNVSYNNLSGTVPETLRNKFSSSSFEGNLLLCFSNSCGVATSISKTRKKSAKFVVLIVLLGACGVALCGALARMIYTRRRLMGNSEVTNKWKVVPFQRLDFNEEEVFGRLDENNVIGCGASGKVYKVNFPRGTTVAVKKLLCDPQGSRLQGLGRDDRQTSSFKAEMDILGKIKHQNIVKLLCSCVSQEAKLLVYEYMPNGSLGDVLHKSFSNHLLHWATRFRIALGAAEGLSYLHHGCVPLILHRDIKSNNILLDSDFQAKLADFGVAKTFKGIAAASGMTGVVGSVGYIAPEYAYTRKVDEKSDVYSYGVVLLELVTGRSPTCKEFEEEGMELVRWVRRMVQSKEGRMWEVFDGRLDLVDGDRESMVMALKIGLFCTSVLPQRRPSMREVVELLRRATPLYHPIT